MKTCTACHKDLDLGDFYPKRSECKACFVIRNKDYRERNKKTISDNKKRYYAENKDAMNQKNANWVKNNPEGRAKHIKKYDDVVRQTPRGNLAHRMSTAISIALKGNKKGRKWESLVGYSVEDLKKNIESQFQSGMTWENMGEWHIDHRIPKSWFQYSSVDDEEFKSAGLWVICNHFGPRKTCKKAIGL